MSRAGEQGKGQAWELVAAPGWLGAEGPYRNTVSGGPGEVACPHPCPQDACPRPGMRWLQKLGGCFMASLTFVKIECGPKCPRQLFSAESLCRCILPPRAKVTIGRGCSPRR